MTVQKRPDNNVFASSAKSGELETFPDILRGWGISFEQTEGKPPMEWFNYLFKRIDESIQYMLQQGLPEWSPAEDYPIYAFTKVGNKIYRALSANKNKAPATNAIIWKEWGLDADSVLLKTNNLSEIKAAGATAQKAARDNIDAASSAHNHDSDYAKILHTHNYLPLSGGEISGKVLFGVNTPTVPIHFIQETETASYHQYSKLTGTLRAILGIISNGLDVPFVICRYDENGNSAARLYLHTDGTVNLSNEKAGASLAIGNDAKLRFKNVEIANVNHNHDNVYAKASHNHDNVYAKASHNHVISDVTNLQSTLDNKASSTHNHDNVYAKASHTHNYLPLAGGEMTGGVLFGVNTPTVPIHFIQETETASYHQYSKLTGTLRAILGIISNGLDVPFVICRYDENGNSAARLYLHTDGTVNLSNEKAGASLAIGNDGVLKFKNQEFTYLNQFASSKSANGWQKLAGGLIIQWGRTPAKTNVVFPIAFPVETLQVIVQVEYNVDGAFNGFDVYPANITNVGFNRPDQTAGCRWIAIGR